ncbi:MAG: orotidine-5'-phosphate decarboxylase [Eubacteriales bacterium]|nr:orotidine-5'-phosphate decarboxylase [Eubacteriales bacterium]
MIQKLIREIKRKNAPVVVGLDPNLSFVPAHLIEAARETVRANESSAPEDDPALQAAAEAVWQFNKAIVDSIYDIVPAVKPQIAMYEQFGIPGLRAYDRTVKYCREKGLIIIGDVKRGDIGSTSASYAKAHIGRIEADERQIPVFDVDFATVNPYFGTDGIEPFVEVCNACDKGIFILVKTSNPSSGEFQDILTQDGTPMYELVGQKVREWGEASMDGRYSNVGAVVGATYPEQGERLRKLMPNTFILAPGYGAQGATAADLSAFFDEEGSGAIVNSSRGIIAAYTKGSYRDFGPAGFAQASRAAALDMIEDLRGAIADRRE